AHLGKSFHIGEVSGEGFGYAWVLDLHHHLTAIVKAGPVHLADRGRRDRCRTEGCEDLLGHIAQLLLEDGPHEIELHGRDRRLERRHAGFLLLVEDVDVRHHLPKLHREALHGAELFDGLLRRPLDSSASDLAPASLADDQRLETGPTDGAGHACSETEHLVAPHSGIAGQTLDATEPLERQCQRGRQHQRDAPYGFAPRTAPVVLRLAHYRHLNACPTWAQ